MININIYINSNKSFLYSFINYYQILILNFDNIINVLFSLKNIDIYVFIKKIFIIFYYLNSNSILTAKITMLN